jgi:ABC-2 type transport system permease protein
MSLRQGSFLWLARHDLSQSWRGFESLFGSTSRSRIILIICAAIATLHVIAWPVALWFGAIESSPKGEARLSAYFVSGLAFILPWIVAQSMTATTRALFTRGDLELVFASPVSPRVVLGAKVFAVALDSVASVAIFVFPLADANALAGRPHWLALYPALFACGFFGAGLGLVFALALFALAGPRRTRMVSQIAATVVGGGFVLSIQAFNTLPEATRIWVLDSIQAPSANSAALARSLFFLPVMAALGHFDAIVEWTMLSLAVFGLAALIFGEKFARAALVSAGAPSASGREGRRVSFRTNLGPAMRAKERRLVLRDPWLLSQIMLQIIYTLPVSVILLRNGGATSSVGIAFAPTIVVVGAQLSGALSWIALSGEDAPEFLATAPVTRSQIDARKIEAIGFPIAMFLAPPILALAWVSPWSGCCAALFTCAAVISSALINVWRQSPSHRAKVLRRHSQSKLVGLIEHLSSILWAVGAGMASLGSWTALVPVAIAVVVLWFARRRRPRAALVSLPAGA